MGVLRRVRRIRGRKLWNYQKSSINQNSRYNQCNENNSRGECRSRERALLIDEIEILKNLEHPNIMKVYESFVDNNNYYIVSELLN